VLVVAQLDYILISLMESEVAKKATLLAKVLLGLMKTVVLLVIILMYYTIIDVLILVLNHIVSILLPKLDVALFAKKNRMKIVFADLTNIFIKINVSILAQMAPSLPPLILPQIKLAKPATYHVSNALELVPITALHVWPLRC
jgi:uncharacterized membrane protein